MRKNSLILILLFITISAHKSLQQFCNGQGYCDCHSLPPDEYEIRCPSDMESRFIVEVKFKQIGRVICDRESSWTDFPVHATGQVQNVEIFQFAWCPLPNETLHDITGRIGFQPTNKLIFEYGNLSSTLERRHLSGFPKVKILRLNANGLTKVPVDLLEDFPELIMLELRENRLDIPLGFFENVPMLKDLELGNNKLTSIDPLLFRGLDKLRNIGLWGNELTKIEEHTFDGLTALESMEISSNKLTTLPEEIFEKLKYLKTLAIPTNNFSSLPDNLVSRNLNLTTFKLNNNYGTMETLPNRFLANLPKLEKIYLENNKFTKFPEDVLSGSSAIKDINVRRNLLTTLPMNIFNNSINLRTLNLSWNRITDLPDSIFETLRKLEKLDLQGNNLTHITNQLFLGLHNLKEINLEHNRISAIDSNGFGSLTELRIARLSWNQITLKDKSSMELTQSPFARCTRLQDLQLAHNNISSIFTDWYLLLQQLRSLDLRYNQLSIVSDTDFQFLSGNITLDIRHNNISRIDLRSAEVTAITQEPTTFKPVIILIEENPIICDCSLYHFIKYLNGGMHPSVQKMFHIKPGNLTCGSPDSMRHITVSDLDYTHFKCDSTFLPIVCPEKCICSYRMYDNTFIANCAYRNISTAPIRMEVHEGFNAYKLEMNLTGNHLNEVPFINLTKSGVITKLYLSSNNISRILPENIPPTLVTFELHNNKLARIDSTVLDRLKNSSSLKNLSLHGNPWKCDCEARDLLSFIQSKFEKIPYILNVTCASDNRPISEMTATDMCPVAVGMIVGVSLGIAVLGLLLGILAALYYRYQSEIKIWLFAHQLCLWFVTEEELDKDKKYDAFISFSHIDEDFVVNKLVPKLEQGPKPFKLCLHFRDWMAGEWIPTQIAKSVEESRRTIVVLSPNFLESVWGRMEFRAAHSQALSEGRARVIVVLYGDVGPTDNLDPELKAYLSMNTYVEWGDPWFWDKLRYALPHPPQTTKSSAKNIYESHQHHIKINGDKNGLINPPGCPVTPPAVTTPPADTLKTFTSNGSLTKGILITDCLQNGLKDYDYPDVKNDRTLIKKESVNNIINAHCTPV